MPYMWGIAVLAVVLAFVAWRSARAGDAGLAPGDPVPTFALVGSDGRTHSLAELRGRAFVVAWFPKAFTGG